MKDRDIARIAVNPIIIFWQKPEVDEVHPKNW